MARPQCDNTLLVKSTNNRIKTHNLCAFVCIHSGWICSKIQSLFFAFLWGIPWLITPQKQNDKFYTKLEIHLNGMLYKVGLTLILGTYYLGLGMDECSIFSELECFLGSEPLDPPVHHTGWMMCGQETIYLFVFVSHG